MGFCIYFNNRGGRLTMANWCTNWVTIEGDEAKIKLLMEEVKVLQKEYETKGFGVRPSDEGDLRYMFDLYINEDCFSFESRWTPANDSLQFLAKKYQVTITNQYSELGCMVFGQWSGDGEIEEDVWLTGKEWDLVVPGDEDETFYIYDGEEYEVQEDALEEILDKKLQGLLHQEK